MPVAPFSVLFVCTGNICRSPTAEGVFRSLVHAAGLADRVVIDSAGTLDFLEGSAPDPRAIAAARRRGYDLSGLRAREVESADLERFDLVLAMDRSHRRHLLALAPVAAARRVRMFLEFASSAECDEVPDPHGGDERDFERVLDLCEDAARGLLEAVRKRIS